jgi:hypothetical protein
MKIHPSQHWASSMDPYEPFLSYLASHDALFLLNPELQLTPRGSHSPLVHVVTTLSFTHQMCWTIHEIKQCDFLTEAGVNVSTIQAVGHWISDVFQIYMQKNPVFLHSLLHG